jgi:hypothetical protein
MSTTLTQELDVMATDTRRDASRHLQSDWGACRLQFEGWPGATAAVKADKKAKMAEAVGAKKIAASCPKFDTKHPAYKALTTCKGKIKKLWEASTLDWVEDGVRLIRQDRIDNFNATMAPLQAELREARDAFEAVYPELVRDARDDNGELYDPSAYLDDFDGQYCFSIEYPSLQPPVWLQGMNPALYAEQSARIAARFDQAVSMAEDMFISELFKAVDFLQGKLQGLDDGTEQRLHETAVENLRDFFKRFQSLNLHSSAELDRVVEQAEAVLSGRNLLGGKPLTKDELRDSASLRSDVRTRLSAVSATLEGMMTAAPRRSINRRNKKADETPAAE